jgi:hypothetical protein
LIDTIKCQSRAIHYPSYVSFTPIFVSQFSDLFHAAFKMLTGGNFNHWSIRKKRQELKTIFRNQERIEPPENGDERRREQLLLISF